MSNLTLRRANAKSALLANGYILKKVIYSGPSSMDTYESPRGVVFLHQADHKVDQVRILREVHPADLSL